MKSIRIAAVACAAALAALPALAQSGYKVQGDVIFERQVAGPPGPDVLQFIGAPMHLEGDTVKGAPYSADAVSETVQVLANGNRIVRKNTSQIYRDSDGRTRREETMSGVGPWASSGGAKQFISINDPTTNTSWHLDPDTKVARKLSVRVNVASANTVSGAAMVNKQMAERQVHVMVAPGGAGTLAAARMDYQRFDPKNAKTEDLGQKSIEGVTARGTRTTVTIPAGSIGNEQPIETVSERWYSDELKTVVSSKTSDPRFGDTTYRLSNVRRAEPAAYLFQVPPDYKVEELAPPSATPQIQWFEKK